MYLFLDRLMFQLLELPIPLTMEILMVHPMENLMELLRDICMDRTMDKNYQPYGYQQHAYSSNYGFVVPHNQGTTRHNGSMQPYMGQMGGGY